MQGLHLTADLRGCASDRAAMSETAALRAVCLEAVASAGLAAVGELFHRFAPGAPDVAAAPGITGVVLLAESHLAVHTWPELDAVTLDVYVCNFGRDNSARAEALLAALIGAFAPAAVERHARARRRGAAAGRPSARDGGEPRRLAARRGRRRRCGRAALKAIVLAAGRGERMRPLSDRTPKPLLEVAGKPLIVWHLEALAQAGVRDVVVNTAWLEDQLVAALGDGSRFGVRIAWSMEGRDHGGALETAGGIAKALPLLGDPFWIVSADVWAPDFRFSAEAAERFVASGRLARLWLVANPDFHPEGDFGLDADGLGLAEGTGPDGQRWTYANIALARAALFEGIAPGGHAKLAPLLYAGMREQRIAAEIHRGRWANVGTPAQLAALAGV